MEFIRTTFSEALEHLKKGGKAARYGWCNSAIWIELQKPDKNSKMTKPYIYMVKYADKFPCDMSCESILADDWKLF